MRLAVLVLVVGCGRIGIEPIASLASDASDASDTGDAPRACPSDTVAINVDAVVCIERTERGARTWTDAKAECEGLGRRLCADAEWATGCTMAPGLIDMFDDGGGAMPEWEWVAELVDTDVAGKRGFRECVDTSSHEIFLDPYDFRCCLDI